MNSNYKKLNLVRVIACFMVLLYHLGLLKGGFFAVCIFFVFSGFLSLVSANKSDNFSLKSYYKKRFRKIYVPLLIVTFLSIFAVRLFTDDIWLNLKPETLSVLLGYNNFWQLNANMDYFAMHSSSPFIHLWYIAILMQFELIFPFIYIILKKLDFNSKKPSIILGLLSIISIIYFYIVSTKGNLMVTYYNTFARMFSIILGMFLASIYINKKPKVFHKSIFYLYLIAIFIFTIFIDSVSKFMPLFMILISLISCRLIDYSISYDSERENKIIKYFSNISYEMYLVQLPIIYLFTNLNIPFKCFIVIISTIVISHIIHLRNKKPIAVCLLIPVLIGGYFFLISKDHTEEMNELERQLNQNEEIFKLKQAEYMSKYKEEEDNWNKILTELENGEEDIKNVVSNLKVVGIGDSVMLGAVTDLYFKFPNGYFDGEVSRTAWVANNIIQNLKSQNILGDPIVFNLGTNGDCSDAEKIRIINSCGNRDIFWINTTNDNNFNNKLNDLSSKYNNLFVIDWASMSSGHTEYFIADGIHLTYEGRQVYTNAIYDAIYKVYLERYQNQKNNIINQHINEENKIIEFFGNNALLNIFEDIKKEVPKSKFNINDYTYESLVKDLKEKELSKNIVFVFDNSLKLSNKEYENLIQICSEKNIFVINFNKDLNNLDGVNFVDFSKNLDDYLMADKIHLSDKGNEELIKIIIENLT